MFTCDNLAVSVSNLTMRYGSRTVLSSIHLEVPRGQRIALLGPNGAGKTTLMETLEGFRLPSAGSVEVLGRTPSLGADRWRSEVGIVFQAANDHRNWRVSDMLTYVAKSHDLAGRPGGTRVGDLSSSWRLDELIGKKLKDLSGGQRRRVDVAVALLGNPEILFLDEPTAGFDPSMRHVFHSVITSISPHTTVLLATHDLEEAESVCDRILLVKEGTIVADGTPDELRRAFTGVTTVTWRTADAGPQRERLQDPAPLIGRLAQDPTVRDLEVRRGTLEDAYLAIINNAEVQMEASAEGRAQ
ncbi:ABC transporter ATP-binding protein [Rathayibacter toxicus]|uniref:ABC transporter ATP-binding protein n=1 Tax=Rathayibacter toxicus TaxID=145458 RepID=UPI001C04A753|nr:ABC transporter ATP-binding protein [Rathayibacter toxicus]QWL29358.1 ABC transporter ATP-binding protein [Rathayibacter toxicus]